MLRDAKESLLDEVRVIPVKTKSGRRTIKKRGQHQGFATVAEAAKFGKAAMPQFTTISYDVEKRGGYTQSLACISTSLLLTMDRMILTWKLEETLGGSA